MRWHLLRNEWVTYAAYRQDRTFLPPPEYNPFAVTVSDDNLTEVPQGDWDIAVFDNRFPALDLRADEAPGLPVPTRPATGKCESSGFYAGAVLVARFIAARSFAIVDRRLGRTNTGPRLRCTNRLRAAFREPGCRGWRHASGVAPGTSCAKMLEYCVQCKAYPQPSSGSS
jgi:hypothetical protein